MKRTIALTLLIVILGLGIGCAAAATPASNNNTEIVPSAPPVAAEAYDDATTSSGVANQRKAQGAPAPAQGGEGDQAQAQADVRMIVYTGSVSLQVNDTAETITKITDILNGVKGYIANKSLVAYGKDKLRGTINVRIPAAALDTTLGQIKALAVKVLKESSDSNDVTAEYVDLEARRKNLEAYEVELQKLLETVRERTGKAEDILAVYNQLTEVRGQIEQIKGRQNYLQNTSTLATYTIELVPVEEPVVEGKPGWDPGKIFTESLDDLVVALQGLVGFAIRLLVVVLPLLLIIVLPIVVIIWLVRTFIKRRTPKKAVTAS